MLAGFSLLAYACWRLPVCLLAYAFWLAVCACWLVLVCLLADACWIRDRRAKPFREGKNISTSVTPSLTLARQQRNAHATPWPHRATCRNGFATPRHYAMTATQATRRTHAPQDTMTRPIYIYIYIYIYMYVQDDSGDGDSGDGVFLFVS